MECTTMIYQLLNTFCITSIEASYQNLNTMLAEVSGPNLSTTLTGTKIRKRPNPRRDVSCEGIFKQSCYKFGFDSFARVVLLNSLKCVRVCVHTDHSPLYSIRHRTYLGAKPLAHHTTCI